MSYTILSGVIERVDAFKLLDVTVSSDVSWEAHVNTICARVDSTALLPETVETYRVACGWVTIFLFDGNKTCLRVWKCRVAPWPDCCTVTKPGVFAEEGPENHLPNYMWYAVWVHVCICWCTALSAQRYTLGRRFFRSITQSDSCLHDLLPQWRDSEILSRLRRHSVYPISLTKTNNKYRSFIHYALAKYQ